MVRSGLGRSSVRSGPKRHNLRVFAPTEGYEDAIIVPAITADNFELKHGLLTLVQNKQCFGHDKEDPHAHIRYFNKITSTLKFPNVLNTSIKLMFFPFSPEGVAWIWLEKEPPRSIFTWDDLVSKFINHEAWDRFKDLLRACPHHRFLELHQLDTFYNALNSKDQDSLNSATGGNISDKMTRECLAIIESKSKVRYSRNKPVVAKVSTNTSFGISHDVAELKDMVKALVLDKKIQNQAPATVKVVEESFVTYGGAHSYRNCPATDGNVYRDNIQEFEDFSAYVKANDAVLRNMQTQGQNMQNQLTNQTDLLTKFVNSNNASTSSSGTLLRNTIANPRSDLNAITTQSGASYDGPQISSPPFFLPKVVENEPEATKDTVHPTNNESTEDVQPQVVQSKSPIITSKPVNSPISKPVISPFKKLGDPGKFLILCDFPGKVECLALADLGASINLMPLSVWNKLYLPDLSPTCMTLELADHSISRPVGVAEDVYVKVEVELKDLPPHLEYAFLKGNDKFPVIIAKDLSVEENTALIMVLKSHKRAIAWKLSDIKGIDPEFCTHKILMEEDFEPAVHHQRRVNPKIHDVIKLEVIKLLDAGMIYPISDSPWVSPVHCVPKKGGFTVVENEDNELIPTRLVTGWRVCIDYHTLNEATRKDHFPLPFMDQMLERLARNQYYCFLDDFFGTFPRCMMAIFHDMIEKTMEVFMDVFSVFGNSFQSCLSHLERMLKRSEDTNLCLNWEKSHFMVKEGIVLGHKISKQRIKVNKAKVHVITKLPHPTTVKGIRSFLGHAGFYRRFIKDFSKIARPMTRLLEKDIPFHFSKECVEAFQTLKRKLTEAPILIAPDWDMPFELMCDASDFSISAVLGQH
nr:retrovirus-related Pol polyprotein [Tanacetum cinerariifolium]